MKKNDVVIGQVYKAKVSGKTCLVRIDSSPNWPLRKGWEATNLDTGRQIYIKSAQRLTPTVRTIADVNRQQGRELREAVGDIETNPKAKQHVVYGYADADQISPGSHLDDNGS